MSACVSIAWVCSLRARHSGVCLRVHCMGLLLCKCSSARHLLPTLADFSEYSNAKLKFDPGSRKWGAAVGRWLTFIDSTSFLLLFWLGLGGVWQSCSASYPHTVKVRFSFCDIALAWLYRPFLPWGCPTIHTYVMSPRHWHAQTSRFCWASCKFPSKSFGDSHLAILSPRFETIPGKELRLLVLSCAVARKCVRWGFNMQTCFTISLWLTKLLI